MMTTKVKSILQNHAEQFDQPLGCILITLKLLILLNQPVSLHKIAATLRIEVGSELILESRDHSWPHGRTPDGI